MAEILDGIALAKLIRRRVKSYVTTLGESGVEVGLGIMRVGEERSSKSYYLSTLKACQRVGVVPHSFELPETSSLNEILNVIHNINSDERINGLLILLPLPWRMNPRRVINELAPEKDVDGLGYMSIGRLAADESTFQILDKAGMDPSEDITMTPRVSGFLPCTPFGVIRLLEHYDIPMKGKNAVVIGKSLSVGKPLAQMLLTKEATVTVCHKSTVDLASFTRNADIVCSATGVRGLVKADMIKEGAVVVDVGINVLDSGEIVGDIDYDGCERKAGHITPVPGGVGPVTIAMLLENTVRSAYLADSIKSPSFLR
jgi:methylenetetrahydrofolate dehydrogenase (NADP+)/methenyltetrahydrofolate cyclohydrolase